MSGASDPNDACLPAPLKDFVFDLHDSARRSHLPSEQTVLYRDTFAELTRKYFDKVPWPSAKAVSSECGDDALFLALYTELTARHLHSLGRPSVSDRIAGWHVYTRLFDALLAVVEGGDATGSNDGGLYLTPDWTFDILHEFVYQFQGFCQFRTNAYGAAIRQRSEGGQPKPAVLENLTVLAANREAWSVEKVLGYLHRLVRAGASTPDAISASAAGGGPAYRHLGLFASVALSRLECLLGDYTSSLQALGPVFDPSAPRVPVGGDSPEYRPAEDVVQSVVPARISLAYHAGVSYLLLRRYRDAAATLGALATYVQRGFKTGHFRSTPHSEQYGRQYDRVLALLAILGHVCPAILADGGGGGRSGGSAGSVVDDSVARVVRERHAAQLTKIESGEEGYEELFVFACPKFISANVPDYNRVLVPPENDDSADAAADASNAYNLQVRNFTAEMDVQSTLRKLRSYMKLYTSIDLGRLAAFNDVKPDELGSLLLTYKHKTRQMQCSTGTSGGGDDADPADPADAASSQGGGGGGPAGGKLGHDALDVHFYVNSGMVHVEEASERQRRFESYFLGQIGQNAEILRDAAGVDTVV
jgi:translation initiation factor 3 subunit L